MPYFSGDAANEITDGEAEGRGSGQYRTEREKREREGKRDESRTHELRNSRNVRTAPHDSSMKNSTQLSSCPTLIISVNLKQPRGGEEREGKGRTAPTAERIADLDLIAYGRDLVGSHVLRIIRGLVRALSRHVAEKYEEISTSKNLEKQEIVKINKIFHFHEKKVVNVTVLLKL